MSKDNSTADARSTLQKVRSIVSIVLVAIVVLIAVLLMGTKIIGLKTFSVISPSMTPAYNVGDLVYVKNVDPETIEIGDAITFVLDENLTVATHRVVGIDLENSHFFTKGDANETPDSNPVHFKNLVGKVVFKLPLLGYVADWVQNPPGTYIAVTIGAVLLILVFLPDMIGKRARKKSESVADAQEIPPVGSALYDGITNPDSAEEAPSADTPGEDKDSVQ